MNRDMMRRVADAIEKGYKGIKFDMGCYADGEYNDKEELCGTSACIAGHVVALHYDLDAEGLVEWGEYDGNEYDEAARYILAISQKEALNLFHAVHMSKPDAVLLMRHAAKTGELNFDLVAGGKNG